MRPQWNDYFMKIAEDVSSRSTCVRRAVGAVIVKDKRILTTGYNGVPKDMAHCTEETCIRKLHNIPSGEKHELCRGLHAEQNAIIQASYHGVSINGADIYVTHQPCSICTKMLINSGIMRFFIKNPYNDSLALEISNEAGVEIIIIT